MQAFENHIDFRPSLSRKQKDTDISNNGEKEEWAANLIMLQSYYCPVLVQLFLRNKTKQKLVNSEWPAAFNQVEQLFLRFIITIKMFVVISAFGVVAIKLRFWQCSSTPNSLSFVTTAFYFLGLFSWVFLKIHKRLQSLTTHSVRNRTFCFGIFSQPTTLTALVLQV